LQMPFCFGRDVFCARRLQVCVIITTAQTGNWRGSIEHLSQNNSIYNGLLLMALGIVLIKKAEIGISPISSIPAALSNITRFTMGNLTIVFHGLCILAIIIMMRRLTVKVALLFPLGVAFGYMIDMFMYILPDLQLSFLLRCCLYFAGIVLTAVGMVMIVGTKLMLPGPDAMVQQVSEQFHFPLAKVKVTGDMLWVAVTLIIELACTRHVVSIGIGTLASMLLTGRFIGVFGRAFPFLAGTKEKQNGTEKK
jgi:uncharacterized membrane protein YczE